MKEAFPIIKINSVSKSFGNKTILRDITLQLKTDRILSILGPSGTGKTTLLRLLAGSLTPDEGEITNVDQQLGYVFQEPRLLPWKTARENVMFSLKCSGQHSRKQQRQLANNLLEKLDLGDFINAYPAQLSGGMKQRVALARAFVLKPDLLLLDEPFSSLDIALKNSLYQMLTELLEWHPATTVLVTHDPEEAVRLADQIIILSGEPGTIRYRLDVPVPRDERNPKTLEEYRQQLVKNLTSSSPNH